MRDKVLVWLHASELASQSPSIRLTLAFWVLLAEAAKAGTEFLISPDQPEMEAQVHTVLAPVPAQTRVEGGRLDVLGQ